MAVLENLEPKRVFSFFEQLCAIPHGSHNTKMVSDWLVDFAEKRGLEHYQDELKEAQTDDLKDVLDYYANT